MKRRDALTGIASLVVAPALLATRARASDVALPRVGLGTWRVFEGAGGADVLRAFVALGGGLVDTAPSYGNEAAIGDALASCARVDIAARTFLATKVAALDRRSALAQVEASVQALRTDVLDLVQVHNLYRLDAMLDVVTGLKRDGRVRFVGVTHVNESGYDELERALSRGVDFVQVNYSAGEREAEKRVLPAARDRGVRVLVNRPFMGGDLLRLVRGRHGDAPRDGELAGIARALDCSSWAELLLQVPLSHPAVACVLPATSRVDHLRENVNAAAVHEGLRSARGHMLDERMRDRITRALEA